MFFDMLVSLKLQGHLSAKSACILSWWAKLGGIASPGDALALPPTRTGGAFSHHFDRILGLDVLMKEDWYRLEIPAHCKHEASRTTFPLAVKPAFESLSEELSRIDDIQSRIEDLLERQELAASYLEHPLVLKHGRGKVLPLGVYIDGVKYGERDNTIGWWCINLATGRRHLMAALPKRDLCRCGCGGNCSIFPVAAFVEWCFAAMADGRYPTARSDGPWPDAAKRNAGQSLGFIGALVLLKGDWAEFASTLGYRSWGHHGHPCFKCAATGGPEGNITKVEGVSVIEEPWAAKGFAEWDAACRACEIHVRIMSKKDLDFLVGALDYDKRAGGSHGRALKVDIPKHLLQKGDRLEPSSAHPDVSKIDFCVSFPMNLTFWRLELSTLVRFRSPLFSLRSCIVPERICVDELHTMHLGVFQDYILAVIWQAIEADVWSMRGCLTEDAYRQNMVNRMRGVLTAWYHRHKIELPEKPLYELKDFRLSMLGSLERPSLNAKAAESGSLLGFALWFAKEHVHKLSRGAALVGAGESLAEYMQVTRSSPLHMSPTSRQRLADAIVRYITLAKSAGILWKPKQHLMVHFIRDAALFWKPSVHWNMVGRGVEQTTRCSMSFCPCFCLVDACAVHYEP